MIHRALTVAGGVLLLFHAWVFGSQLWDGRLAEPSLALRWTMAAGLFAALLSLRQRGTSMLWGRNAVSIWLLAALLHGPAMSGGGASDGAPALPEAVTVAIQIAASSVIVGLGLVLLAALASRLFARAYGACRRAQMRAWRTDALERSPRFSPRPPPVRTLLTQW